MLSFGTCLTRETVFLPYMRHGVHFTLTSIQQNLVIENTSVTVPCVCACVCPCVSVCTCVCVWLWNREFCMVQVNSHVVTLFPFWFGHMSHWRSPWLSSRSPIVHPLYFLLYPIDERHLRVWPMFCSCFALWSWSFPTHSALIRIWRSTSTTLGQGWCQVAPPLTYHGQSVCSLQQTTYKSGNVHLKAECVAVCVHVKAHVAVEIHRTCRKCVYLYISTAQRVSCPPTWEIICHDRPLLKGL